MSIQAKYDAKDERWLSKSPIPSSSKFYMGFDRVVGRPPTAWHWPAEWLDGCYVEARVRTVRRDCDGDALPNHAEHSKVDKVLALVAGTPRIMRTQPDSKP